MSTTTNKAIVRRFYEEVFNQRKIDAIDELVHPEFTNHDPTPVASRDPESMKQFIHIITQAFSDQDMPPTGKSICQRQIHILRIRDSKVAEHRVVRDDLTMMQQLGLIPQPELTTS
jgi:SnoaL-like polyketide cyclase